MSAGLGTLPRVIALQGATNLRDLGGYATADGRRMRFGLVFRSAALAGLTDDDLATVGALGLRTVCDLRGLHEAERAPSRLPDGVTAVPMPIEPTVGASLRDILERGQATGEDVFSLLAQAYTAYATAKLPVYRALFATMLEADRLPLLFHCSAGKDRTGFGAALLLTLLGVPRATVMQDYLATNGLWRSERVFPPGTAPEVAQTLMRAHAPLLEAALERALSGHDSIDDFAEASLGLDATRLRALRQKLLE
ncbi:tyrosine-protein phosphatase [Roseomonas sp. 18066]|uniref:tyrosine-protein phosphatase n=1 Tax=Roseomonas sp. 18066 TaxID=2681412 RepID=UPI00135B850A|nr:tyrosine-protein phosphatase [Roseomonas sp. 18066]